MDTTRVAELQALLEGVQLPAEKAVLLVHAVQQRAEPAFIDALRELPDRRYESLDEVGEELVHVEPASQPDEAPMPREERGGAPDGDEA